VGDGPVGVDLVDDGAGGVEVLTTGYNSDDYTLTPVASDGTPGTPVTRSLTDCTAPGFGAYVGEGSTHIAITCQGSGTIRVFERP